MFELSRKEILKSVSFRGFNTTADRTIKFTLFQKRKSKYRKVNSVER